MNRLTSLLVLGAFGPALLAQDAGPIDAGEQGVLTWAEARAAYLALVESGQPTADEAENGWAFGMELGAEASRWSERFELLGLEQAEANERARNARFKRLVAPDPLRGMHNRIVESLLPTKEQDSVAQRFEALHAELEQSGFFERTKSLATFHRFVPDFPQLAEPWDFSAPHWLQTRLEDARRLLESRMERAVRRGDKDDLEAAHRELIHIARIGETVPSLRLWASRGTFLPWQVEKSILNGCLNPELARALLRVLNVQPEFPPISRDYEARAIRPWFQMWGDFSTADKGDGEWAPWLEPGARLDQQNKHALLSNVESRLAAAARVRPAERMRAGRDPGVIAGELCAMGVDPQRAQTSVSLLHFAEASEVERRAWQVLIALECFKADQGAYPDELARLVPEYLARIPEDIFAPDGQFRYRRIDPKADELQREFILYSVALDGEDNGGAEIDDDRNRHRADMRACAEVMPGADMVLSRRGVRMIPLGDGSWTTVALRP